MTMLRLGCGYFEAMRPSLVSKTAHRYAERPKESTWGAVVERVRIRAANHRRVGCDPTPLIRLGDHRSRNEL
jgi:hypothetical protein